MQTIERTGLAIAAAFALAALPAQAATIANENFEAGASGWSDNKTEDPGANTGGFSRHLGRHGAGAFTSKTFSLSGAQSLVSVAFDFYRIDTWDGEFFRATITDGINSFTSSTQGLFFDAPPGAANIYGTAFADRINPIAFDFATTASSITLSFSSTLDQGLSDEAWGVDNLVITDNVVAPGAVPEPSAWALLIFGFGVVGAGMRQRRRSMLAFG